MGFNRIAKAVAVMTVMALATSARAADERLSMMGYFRVSEGWQLTNVKGAQVYYGLGPSKMRLGNENDWAEFGWNLLAYKGEDGTIGHVVIMIGGNYDALIKGVGDPPFSNWQGDGSHSPVFKELFVDVQKIPGLADATIWAGKKYYKRYYSPVNDMFFWSNDAWGAGLEDINLGFAKLSYALFDLATGSANTPQPDNEKQGMLHDLRLTDIALGPAGKLDVGVGLAHPISEGGDTVKGGFMGNARWTIDVLGGNNQLALQYGTGACATSDAFGANQGGNFPFSGIDVAVGTTDRKKMRVLDALSISPNKQIGVDLIGMLQIDDPTAAADDKTTTALAGGRLSFHFASHASLLFEAGYAMSKPEVGDTGTLIKVTPALEVGTGYGNVPHVRLYVTYAKWNDAANGGGGGGRYQGVNTGGGAYDPTKTDAVGFGIQGESWF